MRKQYHSVMRAAAVAVSVLVAGRTMAGSLNPTNAPSPTMHTLEDIYQKLQSMGSDNQKLLSATTAAVSEGYYMATNLTLVDTDLVAGNIATNVTIFGVVGTLSTSGGSGSFTSAVPRTGQTTVYVANDDGAYQKGVVWPSPRFTVGESGDATNCVTDNLTGLVWARNANICGAGMTWTAAITACEDLIYGGQTDWRLPNAKELASLVDFGHSNPALPSGHPFFGSQLVSSFWTSTTYSPNTGMALGVNLNGGTYTWAGKYDTPLNVLPVRGGQ